MSPWPEDASRKAARTLSEDSPLYEWVTGPEDPDSAARRSLEESQRLLALARRLVRQSNMANAEVRRYLEQARSEKHRGSPR